MTPDMDVSKIRLDKGQHDDPAEGDPADRVREFLAARAQDRMSDPEVIHSYGRGGFVYELRVADLHALVRHYEVTR